MIGDSAVDRHRVRRALLQGGGSLAAGAPATHAPAPVARPFATAEVVEGTGLAAIALGEPAPPPEPMGFLDGVQRYWIDGRFGLTPVIRADVAAAAMRRAGGSLLVEVEEREKFLVVAWSRLNETQRRALDDTGLAIHRVEAGSRAHPLLDVQAAVQVIESRRDRLEARVAGRFLEQHADSWLLVDGAITGLGSLAANPRVVGLIKSHETQFLDGADLETALTIRPGQRTSVFARVSDSGVRVFSWYVRLWPWNDQDLLHGLLRVERSPVDRTISEATMVSRWLQAERAPLSTPDGRWDRLLYPIHRVEEYLRAQGGAG